MKKTVRILVQSGIVVLLAALLIAGVLLYTYAKTDETAVPIPEISMAGQALAPDAFEWYTPVFEGMVYKSYTQAVECASTQPAVFDVSVLELVPPAQGSVNVVLKDSAGTPIPVTQQAGPLQLMLPKNDTYTYQISVDIPKEKGQAYGAFTYSGSFTIAVQPKILFSSFTGAQGDVITVLVSDLMDENPPLPTIETDLGLAVFAKDGSGYRSSIGISYNTSVGEYPVTVTYGDIVLREKINVTQAQFSRQDMIIDAGIVAETVDSAAANQQWRDAIVSLYATADDEIYWQGDFKLPLDQTIINTEYGLFRYTNGSPNAERHGGIDLDGETGDTVYATASGRVAYAGFLTLTGNTVVIEHGAGLKSYYFHMDSLNCATNDKVERGQVIGTVGTTGYSTGAHLHFEIKIGRQSINPLSLINGTSGLYYSGDN